MSGTQDGWQEPLRLTAYAISREQTPITGEEALLVERCRVESR